MGKHSICCPSLREGGGVPVADLVLAYSIRSLLANNNFLLRATTNDYSLSPPLLLRDPLPLAT